jgi:HD-GYP domain-containing protein (c-di-GMP phosphodiesterase class II)
MENDSGAKAPVEKFFVPAEWRERCEFKRLNPQNKPDYTPLHLDLIRALLDVKSIDFVIYFLVGWDLYEFVRPATFSTDLIKEMVDVHKKWPNQTRILVLRKEYFRYEKIATAYRKTRYTAAAAGAAMPLMPVFNCYNELANASQTIARGALHAEIYPRIADGASYTVLHMPSMKDVATFLVNVIGKDPVLYDHGAVAALFATSVCWNVLRLNKRESKLCGQAALLHDVERNCAYLLKPSVPNLISAASVKEIATMRDAGVGFHEAITQAMEQYRERFAGGGMPHGLSGPAEQQGGTGIARPARIVAISCFFAECLLKRKEKLPLTLPVIMDMISHKSGKEFDPQIIDLLVSEISNSQVRKANEKSAEEDLGDDD